MAAKEKPSLELVRGDASLNDLVEMFKKLAGREPSDEEIEAAKQTLRDASKTSD